MRDVELFNGSNLSYIGDAYYELQIRLHLLELGITKSKELNRASINYVSAHAHQLIFNEMKDNLTEEEWNIFRRGRNSASMNYRKNVDQGEYATSSGFEAIIGYWYLKNNESRLKELIQLAIQAVERGKNE